MPGLRRTGMCMRGGGRMSVKKQIYDLANKGMDVKFIANKTGFSKETVQTHMDYFAKTYVGESMYERFEQNRKAIAEHVSEMSISNKAKNELGTMLTTLSVSAFATGFGAGKNNNYMPANEWLETMYDNHGIQNDNCTDMVESIAFDFHALGGVK